MFGHGSYELTLNKRVLVAKIIGAWNKEEGEHYFYDLKNMTEKIVHQPWAMMVYLDKWELGTPGSDEVTLELIKWLAANNLAVVAEVYSPSLLKKKHIQDMVDSASFPIKRQCFSKEQDAFNWLESEGFPMDLNSPP